MRQIICYGSILAIVIFLNVRAWDMTRGESLIDPINWGGAAMVVAIGAFMLWKERKE